jgi:DNA mismatch endonuclease, patch repair protein
MSQVKSKNTTPEIVVRRAAQALGLRFRLHREDLPGKPDLVFPRWRAAILVNGGFRHSHEVSIGVQIWGSILQAE